MRIGIAPLFQNYQDWERFSALERGEAVPPVDDGVIMREQFAIGDLAEPLGYDSLWTFEHRNSPYIMLPNPQQFVAYFAGRTKRIDFGSMVTVMPWHHPVRLAENLSLLQHMLGPNRRFIMGIGRGLARREYQSLGIDMNESRERMAEGIDLVKQALSGEVYELDGQVYKVPRSTMRPRPIDASFIDDLYGVWTSEGSMHVAAQLGLNPMTIPSKSLEAYAKDLGAYHEIRATYGHGPAKAPILQVFMHCAETESEARSVGEEHAYEYAQSAHRHYEFGGDHFQELKNYDSYVSGQKSIFGDANTDLKKEAGENAYKLIKSEGLFGTPQQCIERLAHINEIMSPAEVVTVCSYGTMSAKTAEKSLRLFAEKVLPAAHAIKPLDLAA